MMEIIKGHQSMAMLPTQNGNNGVIKLSCTEPDNSNLGQTDENTKERLSMQYIEIRCDAEHQCADATEILDLKKFYFLIHICYRGIKSMHLTHLWDIFKA